MSMTEHQRLNYGEMRECIKGLIKHLRVLVEKGRELPTDPEGLKEYHRALTEADVVLKNAEARKGRW